jgi:outer membrane protein TolC
MLPSIRSSPRWFASLFVVSLVLAAGTPAARSAPLGLAEAQRLAVRDQPRVEALRESELASSADADAGAELEDPELIFGVQNLPVTGEDAFQLESDDMTMLGIGVMQRVKRRATRQAAAERLRAQAAGFGAAAREALLAARREAALAWLDVREALERREHYARLVAEVEAERAAAGARARVAEGAVADALRADAELARMRDAVLVATRDENRGRANLARWIGEDATRPLSALPTGGPAPSIATDEPHPLLLAAGRAVDAAQRDADLARAERHPDWSWQLMYGRRGADRSDMITAQFTVDLPLNREDRQDRRLASSLALARRAQFEAEDAQRMLDAERGAARAELESADSRLAEIERSRLPSARALLASATAGYAAGRVSLEAAWQARRECVEAELDREIVRIERERARQRLAYLDGTPAEQS